MHKKDQETQYIQQLKNASWQAQLIKLCDISSDLKSLQTLGWSKTKKSKQIKKMLQCQCNKIRCNAKQIRDSRHRECSKWYQ